MDNSINGEQKGNNFQQPLLRTGCGCNDPSSTTIIITISPTTGGQFTLEMKKTDTIDHLNRVILKKLKVSRERICLLYRDR